MPRLEGELDVTNFDEEFTSEEAINSVSESNKIALEKFDSEFGGVSYTPSGLGGK